MVRDQCQTLQQNRAAADHLPKFRFGADDLEEDEIDDLRYVDAGVEHVDRDGDIRRLIGLIKIIEQRLCVSLRRGPPGVNRSPP